MEEIREQIRKTNKFYAYFKKQGATLALLRAIEEERRIWEEELKRQRELYKRYKKYADLNEQI
jgi:hypothetical protein